MSATPTPGAPGANDPNQPQNTPTPGGAPSGGNPTPTPGTPGGNQNPDIQRAIDAIVARERQAAEARETALRRELDELKAKLPKPEQPAGDAATRAAIEAARKPLEEQLAAVRAELEATSARTVRAEIRAIAAELSVDPDDVAERLAGKVKRNAAGVLEVIGQNGQPEYNATGVKTAADAVRELLEAKPYLKRSGARTGAGVGDAPRNANAPAGDVAALKQQIAELEAKGKFGEAAPLKSQLLDLVNAGKK